MNAHAGGSRGAEAQIRINERLWASKNLLAKYSGRVLRPPEVILLVRHRDALQGRVLELGCGGGRLSGYLIEIASELHGLDISPVMISHCRSAYPEGSFEQGDLRDLSRYGDGRFDAVCAPFNVLDVLDDAERRRTLSEIARILAAEGTLIMSSHNLAHAPLIPKPTQIISPRPVEVAKRLIRLPRRERNRRRLLPLQRIADDHAVLVDPAHDYGLLHYYIGRDAQERQLAETGFDLLECLDSDGRRIEAGEQAASHSELHYAARRSRRPDATEATAS